MHPAEGREEKEQISANKKEAPFRVLPFCVFQRSMAA